MELWLISEVTEEQATYLQNALERTGPLIESLGGVIPEAASEWRVRMLIGLVTHTANAYRHLRRGHENADASLLGWAARNLLELRIWVRYIMHSEGNIRRAHDDSLIDHLELCVGHIKFLQGLTKTPERESSLQAMEATHTELKHKLTTASLSEASKRLQIADISREVGLGQLYSCTFKVLSKLVHPSSLAMLSPELSTDEGKSATGWVFVLGTQCALEALQLLIIGLGLEQHVDKWTASRP